MFQHHRGNFGRGEALWQELSPPRSDSPLLHFSAANGFPVNSYRFFLDRFRDDFHILGLENRGMWGAPPTSIRNSWQGYANDLIAFLQHQRTRFPDSEGVIAVGHSIGGTVSALAAAKRPDLFRAVIMIDPATFPGRRLPYFAPLISPWLTGRLNLVTGTRRRRRQWPSPEAFIQHHLNKPAYQGFSAEAFSDYASAVLDREGDGYRLLFDPDWESLNFRNISTPWRALRKTTVPTLVLRAEHSYMYNAAIFNYHLQRSAPLVDHDVILDAGHMAPQEDCSQVVTLCRSWLDNKGLL